MSVRLLDPAVLAQLSPHVVVQLDTDERGCAVPLGKRGTTDAWWLGRVTASSFPTEVPVGARVAVERYAGVELTENVVVLRGRDVACVLEEDK